MQHKRDIMEQEQPLEEPPKDWKPGQVWQWSDPIFPWTEEEWNELQPLLEDIEEEISLLPLRTNK